MSTWQSRLMDEALVNSTNVLKLQAFINSDAFKALDLAEQQRQYRQCALMRELEVVHKERIDAFRAAAIDAHPDQQSPARGQTSSVQTVDELAYTEVPDATEQQIADELAEADHDEEYAKRLKGDE